MSLHPRIARDFAVPDIRGDPKSDAMIAGAAGAHCGKFRRCAAVAKPA